MKTGEVLSGWPLVIKFILFAHNIVLVVEVALKQTQVIKRYIDKLCLVLGRMVSFVKSRIQFSRNTSIDAIDLISNELGIQ